MAKRERGLILEIAARGRSLCNGCVCQDIDKASDLRVYPLDEVWGSSSRVLMHEPQ